MIKQQHRLTVIYILLEYIGYGVWAPKITFD